MRQNGFLAIKQSATALILALATSLAVPTTQAQEILHATTPLPSFEVATVKPEKSDSGPSAALIAEGAATDRLNPSPGAGKITRQTTVSVFYGEAPPSDHVHLTFKTKSLIAIAYGLPLSAQSRIFGGPTWIDNDAERYEVNARIDGDEFTAMQKMSPQERGQTEHLMEQALLADRFHLKVHFETRDLPVYTLVIARGGPKMAPARPDEISHLTGTGDGQNNVLTAQHITIGQLLRSPLLRLEGRMVLDRTSLTAAYDFTLKSAIGSDPDATGPSLFTAMEEQLGLKLVPAKAPLEVIVIDHIDRPEAN